VPQTPLSRVYERDKRPPLMMKLVTHA